MSLSYEYFVCENFELLKKVKTELENMLKKDMIKNNSKEWADILKNKLSQIETLYNNKSLEGAINADANGYLYKYLEEIGYDKSSKIDELISKTLLEEPHFFELGIINNVINFASSCETVKDFKKIYSLPKIPADLDYNNPANKYSPFMREDTQEKINKCLKIKNENPVYSDCYILVTNHYDRI